MKKTIALLLSLLLSVLLIGSLTFAEESGEIAPEEIAEAAEETAETAAQETAEVLEEDAVEVPEETADDLADSLGDSAAVAAEVNLSAEGEVEVDDYSVIEIPENAVQVTDEEIDSYINSMLNYSAVSEQIAEGTAEEGDAANIDFSGVLEGEEEPFAGGTAQGYEITLGSGMFIPGFEEQVIGHAYGETFDINVTFPEEYTEELAGKNAIFTITLNYKTVTTIPELTDEFVQEFSAAQLDTQLQTVEELREYTRDYLYRNKLYDAIFSAIGPKIHVVTYPEDLFELLKAYNLESLEYYVSMYAASGLEGYDADMIAQISGFASADDYCNQYAMNDLNTILLIDKIAKDKGIEITDEELDSYVSGMIDANGLTGVYTVEEFKEISGEAWVTIAKYNVLLSKVLESLEENVVFVEGSMSYADFQSAEVDAEVSLDLYVQATQNWYDGAMSVYAADRDGGYFIYNLACSEEDAQNLVPGTKIHVTGYKSEWSGEIEIADAAFEIMDDGDTYVASTIDATALLGTEELVNLMNQKVSFAGLTVEASQDADGNEAAFLYNYDGSGTQGDDLYFNVSLNGTTYTFTVESNLCGADTEVYKAVKGLNVGDVIDAEGFLYWYNGANPHITSVTVK
ncbi:MAG: FKBP-type peptidyl-prolyl cis-trans isomerase [Parasporobacterium sp.]|nr:FKBP-type peptidyl-prolyl cis-trans isomerase [Parasporobacterium sp.]